MIYFDYELLIVAIRGKELPEREYVLIAVIAFERLCDRVVTASDPAMTHSSEHYGISLPVKNGIENPKPALSGYVAQHPMELKIHLIEGFLNMQHML